MTNFISKDLIGTFFPDPQMRQLYASAQVIHTLIAKETIFHLIAYISNYLKTQGTLQSLKVGIIGLGHIGTSILEEILHLQILSPEQVLVSTRTPDKHRKFIEQGLRVIWDNEQVAKECDFIILACLPHQIDSVCSSIRSILSNKNKGIFTFTEEEKNPSTMIFSILAATPIAKVKQLTDNYPFILRSYIDVDLINKIIASFPEEISPLSICIENLPSHFARTANDVRTFFEVFNAVFYGAQDIRDEIIEFFCGAVTEEGEYVSAFNNRFKEIMKEFGSI
ncbi:unnamed protein product [Blepharisma stoltei]|uniref:Pyrroline-5-carboxylate reductase catalytic N-terminal domain-containing protein n=1 Tax=Blepharisma stoltei TaxID=1481888 RepID=A0AAU9JFY1_9CILI|nr:unnamed protein product [Blepharisma stoltei]